MIACNAATAAAYSLLSAGRVNHHGSETRTSSVRKGTAPAFKRNGAGVAGNLIRMNYEGLKALRQLALDKDRTLQSLGIEAFNDLLRKYSVRPVLENPLLRTRVE